MVRLTKEKMEELNTYYQYFDCAIIYFDSGYNLIYANSYFEALTGYTLDEFEEVFHDQIFDIIHPEDRQKFKSAISKQLYMGDHFEFEVRCLTKSGATKWMLLKGHRVPQYNQYIFHVAAIDITTSKEAFKELSQAKVELNMIADHLEGGILKLGVKDYKIYYANEGFFRLGGYSRYEYLEKYEGYCRGIVHPDDVAKLDSTMSAALKNRETFSAEYRIIHKSGRIRWSHVIANYLEERDHSPIYLCILVDITKLKTYEDALLFEQKKNKILSDMNKEYLWEYNYETHILERTGTLDESYSDKDIIEHGINQLYDDNILHPDDAAVLSKYLENPEKVPSTFTTEVRMKNHLGIFTWYQLQGIAFRDNAGTLKRLAGKTKNINDSKNQLLQLENEAKHDSLTHTLSREATQSYINHFFKGKTLVIDSAMVLIDIRQCRQIQESYGQLFTESLIKETVKRIKGCFPTATIGRIDFDLFCIFLEECASRKMLMEELTKLKTELLNIQTGQKLELDFAISAAFSNQPDAEYEQLFRNADTALYEAKKKKIDINFYDGQSHERKSSILPVNDLSLAPVRKYSWESEDYMLLNKIILSLCEADDVFRVIPSLLEKMAQFFHVDQVYVIEYQPENNLSSIISFYHTEQTKALLPSQMGLPLDQVKSYEQLLVNGIISTNDLETIRATAPCVYDFVTEMEVRSLVNCAFYDHENITGYLALNDCFNERIWTDADLQFLKIISSFLGYVLKQKNTKSKNNKKQFDTITHLPLFPTFLEEGSQTILRNFAQKSNEHIALISIDINKFHSFNLNYGFSIGNKILVKLTGFLRQFLKPGELCSRLQNDLFYLLILYNSVEELEARISNFLSDLSFEKFSLSEYNPFYTAMGVYLIEDKEVTLTDMIDKANYARLASKQINDSHSYTIFSEQLGLKQDREAKLRVRVKDALVNHEIIVLYQPKYDLLTEKIAGSEALIRWKDEDGNLLLPDTFLPLMHQENQLTELDFYVIEEVCRTQHDIKSRGKKLQPVSINISQAHLHTADFTRRLINIVSKYEIPIGYLHLEMDETCFMDEPDTILSFIKDLKNLGFYLILSHFGRFSSSLELISKYPVDMIKFDLNFFRKHCETDSNKVLLQKTVEIAHALGKTVSSVGLETELQKLFLFSIGCDYIQGYLFHKPLTSEDFEKYLL